MLRLIVTNLLSNAAAYTPQSGALEIVARTGRLTVTNDAPDLNGEAIDHLFERFWRADGSRTDGSHSGLGLSLARACARALGLQLAAEHIDGRLIFTVSEETTESSPASSLDNLAGVE
jgi:signal transduction histidine kinase